MTHHPLALFLLVATASAQDAPARAPDARLTALVTLDSHHPFSPPEDAQTWLERRVTVRRQVLIAAGLWPGAPTCEPNPVVHGALERDGYLVERVFFESLPGFFVTGSLYRPRGRGNGPFPGVLSPHGHWAQGRFTVIAEEDARRQIELGHEDQLPNAQHHLQARCARLARMGCVVFHYDMIGYADSRQLDHRRGFGDVQAELWGMSHFGLQTLNTLRAFEFLAGLEDVDPARVGVTGGSGGGTQTFILGAVDDRPAVLFPAVMVSTGMQGGCACENASGLRIATGNIELAAMAAPRPLGLTGANDWTLHIMDDGFPELRALYSTLGVSDGVAAWCYPDFPHNYNRVSRGRMYEWFNEHLDLGVEQPNSESSIDPIAPDQLAVFDGEHPFPEDALDLAGVREVLLDHARGELAQLARWAKSDPAEFRRVVGGALQSMTHARLPAQVEVVTSALSPLRPVGEEAPAAGPKVILSRPGKGEWVLLSFPRGQPTSGEPVLVVSDSPGEGEALALLDAGDTPYALLHPLGVERMPESGAILQAPVDPQRHGTYVGYSWGYNLPLIAHRVQDVLTAVAYLKAQAGGQPVRLVGLGGAGPWTLLAAALAGEHVSRVVADGGFRFSDLSSLQDPNMLPRALRSGGMQAMAALIAPRPLLWVGEAQPPAMTRALYRAQGAAQELRARAAVDPLQVAAWLHE